MKVKLIECENPEDFEQQINDFNTCKGVRVKATQTHINKIKKIEIKTNEITDVLLYTAVMYYETQAYIE